jgi:hypothetical protein
LPLGSPHRATADGSKTISASREDQGEPSSLVISSEQKPSWLVLLGLDDASGQQYGLAQKRFHVLSIDPVLPVLGPVAGIPIEILRDTLQGFEPGGNLRVVDEPHSYCIAMPAQAVKQQL